MPSPVTDLPDMTPEQRRKAEELHARIDASIRRGRRQAQALSGPPAPPAKREDEIARTLGLVAAPFVANMLATAALRRLLGALAAVGVPVVALERAQARRIAWPAMLLLRLAGGALRGATRPPAELTELTRSSR
jgi:hypothetical protein